MCSISQLASPARTAVLLLAICALAGASALPQSAPPYRDAKLGIDQRVADLLSRMIRKELDRSEGKPDRLLLYIDQWEELYAQAPSQSVEKDRAARHTADVNRFIDLLLNAAQSAPVSVVATVRADFYDPLISHHKIQALLPAQQSLMGEGLAPWSES